MTNLLNQIERMAKEEGKELEELRKGIEKAHKGLEKGYFNFLENVKEREQELQERIEDTILYEGAIESLTIHPRNTEESIIIIKGRQNEEIEITNYMEGDLEISIFYEENLLDRFPLFQ